MAHQQDISKSQIEMVENSAIVHGDGAPVMRAKADDLSVWQSVRKYKRVGFIAMAASFCASLDGYRKTSLLYLTKLLLTSAALLDQGTHVLTGPRL